MENNNPPVDLRKYLGKKKRRYVSYAEGAKELRLPYWTFVQIAKRAGATVRLKKTAVCDMTEVYSFLANQVAANKEE